MFGETVEGFEPRVGDHAAVLDLHAILGPIPKTLRAVSTIWGGIISFPFLRLLIWPYLSPQGGDLKSRMRESCMSGYAGAGEE